MAKQYDAVQGMEESVTYQEILEKGIERGKAEGERAMLIRQGTAKFGPPGADALARLAAVTDSQRLEDLSVRLLHAAGWDELLGPA